MSVITQDGDSALMMAIRWGRTEIVLLLLEAGANTDLQNKVKMKTTKMQNPQSIPHIKPIMLVYWPCLMV